MTQKVYTIENIDCANCASKIEHKLNALPEVQEALITFATRELRITAEDPDALIPRLQEIARTVEMDAVIAERKPHRHTHHASHEHHHDHEHGCACGHDHAHEHECACGHDHSHEHGCTCGHDHTHEHKSEEHDLRDILLGAGLFALALVLGAVKLGIFSTVAYLAAYLVLGWEVLVKAAKNLTKGHVLDENFLMGIASVGAFCIGEMAEGVGVILFYRVGEYFEDKAMQRSRSQIMDAVDLRPDTVNLLRDGEVCVIPAEDAAIGDTLLVRPGDRIPLDGTVLDGDSRIDTAPITGESVPVHVCPGDSVVSGCVNADGLLTIRVDRVLSESMVTRILSSVENAAASKPKIDRFITRFARIYTPLVVGAAALIAVVPSLITKNPAYWVYTALSFLVMSCPCALVLSVPLAFFAGIGAGSKQGILFKGGISMEAMKNVKAVVMDKTGTLTQGNFRVQETSGEDRVLALAAGCEQHSAHPIAQSVTAAAKECGLPLVTPEALEEIAGRGIRARVDGKTVLCGNERLLEENGVAFPRAHSTGTIVYVAEDGKYVGSLLIADTVKNGAQEALHTLKTGGLHTVMLTGDNEETAAAVAKQLGIDEVHAKLLPDEKLRALTDIRTRHGAVMFVGDGINDAPVLAGADVGAAMGSGADAAIEAADVVYLTNDVRAIPASLEIARRTNRIAWQNVTFALTVKALVMLLGLLGYASMWLAVFADSGVAMLCVLNSIRTLYRKK